MKSIVPIIGLLILLNQGLNAQLTIPARIDSLQAVIVKTNSDEVKANALIALSDAWLVNDPDKSIEYATRALKLSIDRNNKRGQANAQIVIGRADNNLGKYEEALNNLTHSLQLAKSINDESAISNALNNIAIVYDNQSNFSLAVKNYNDALKLQETVKDKKAIADIYSNLGYTNECQGKFDDALKNQLTSLHIREAIGDEHGIAISYNRLGTVYKRKCDYIESMKNFLSALKIMEHLGDKSGMAFSYLNMGIVYFLQENFTESKKNSLIAWQLYTEIKDKRGVANAYGNFAIWYYHKNDYTEAIKSTLLALKILTELGDKQDIGSNYNNLGFLYKQIGMYKEAMKYLLMSVKVYNEIGDKANMAETYETIGEVSQAMDQYPEALTWLKKALEEATALNDKRVVKESYLAISDVYIKLNDYKNAYKYHKLYSEIKQAIDDESSQQIAEMKTNYETEKREDKITLLNKDKVIQQKEISRQKLARNTFIGGFVIVLLFAGIFLIQRNHITKEKKRSDDLLLNILPSETAEELKATGEAEAKSYDLVTVLFTDFKDFTKTSEKMSAKELVKEIHHCFSEFDKIISNYGIEKIKTIGDSYMCAGGLPVENKTNPVDVVKAAIEIQQFMQDYNEERKKDGMPLFEMRVGVHTGPVVAGIVGIKKFAYDIWGDTVNIAARMESSGEAGRVNISEATYELVKDKFNCTCRGKIVAKNKGEMNMYFVDGAVV